jgi:hypothetical protein
VTFGTAHADVREMLGAYALDAVDRADATLVTQHLAECPRCLGELDALREIACAIGTMVEPVPPQLWDRIAEHMDDSLRASFPADRLELNSNRWSGAQSAGSEGSVRSTRADHRRRAHEDRGHVRAVRVATSALGIAAAVVVALLLAGWSSANSRVSRLDEALAAKGDAAAVSAAVQVPGHKVVDLRSVEGRQAGQLVLLPGGRGYLVSSTMPALPGDETYQLWGLIDGQPISLGLLGSHPSQAAFTVSAASPSQFMVTIEPVGGVTTPDRGPIATGVVAHV